MQEAHDTKYLLMCEISLKEVLPSFALTRGGKCVHMHNLTFYLLRGVTAWIWIYVL
jgi:hypothetical protein